MTIGFLGAGNMASAIIEGLISSACFAPQEIAVFDIDKQKCVSLQTANGVRVCEDAVSLVRACDCVVLAVKPQVLSSVLEETRPALQEKRPLLISIAAGKTLSFLRENVGFDAHIIRVMPNINAVVQQAVSAYCGNEAATDDDLAFADCFCGSFGKATFLPESLFPIFGVIGGCSPAFVYLFIDALARAAVEQGMPKDRALEISAQAVLGSAQMVLSSDDHPYTLVDRVCSPGGTTIEGVLSLQKNGFEAAVHDAVRAAFEKDKLL